VRWTNSAPTLGLLSVGSGTQSAATRAVWLGCMMLHYGRCVHCCAKCGTMLEPF
jgi:hypothetical protein